MLDIIINWLPEHFLISTISLLIYVISTNVKREKRQPAIAIAWVVGLALLPYIVLPLYLVFGQRKVRLHIDPPQHFPEAIEHSFWATKVIESFHLPGASKCDITFHKDGKEALDGLYKIINLAKSSIDIEIFIFEHDSFGKEFLQHLIECLKKGIKVRILVDAVGSLKLNKRVFDNFVKEGGEFRFFRQLFKVKGVGPINLRNHRKLVIVDGVYLWSGGRNLSAQYFLGTAKETSWIDLSFDLRGGVATSASYQFEVDWAYEKGCEPTYNLPSNSMLDLKSNSIAQFLPSGPDQIEDTANSLLVNALYRANKYFLAITPYFVPDSSLIDAMRLAARRGVEVTIVMPEYSNHKMADFARSRSIRSLSKSGVKIKFLPYMCHAKAFVSDDNLAICGSVNMDQRSLLINYEASVVFYSDKEIIWMKQWIQELEATCKNYIPKKVSLLRDVTEGICLALGYQL